MYSYCDEKKQLCISPAFPDSNDAEHLLSPPPYGENIELRALSISIMGGCLLNIFKLNFIGQAGFRHRFYMFSLPTTTYKKLFVRDGSKLEWESGTQNILTLPTSIHCKLCIRKRRFIYFVTSHNYVED